MKKLPDLEAWAIFAKVAKTGSFAKTAAELSLSQASVSKAITRLEKRMNTMLFHRTSRRMSLTETGYIALERASLILEESEALEEEVTEQSSKPCGLIRLTAPMSFGIKHMAPLLPKFMLDNPEVSLDIEFSDDLIDVVANRFDIALRISNLVDSSLLARRLCTVRLLLVGAPDYFKRYGRPYHPRDLVEHRMLQYAYPPRHMWRFRHEEHGEVTQSIESMFKVNNAEALNFPLHAGLGLALQPEFLVQQEIETGVLETVMNDWSVDPITLYIVTPPGRRRPKRVQVLIDYFVECFAN
ncbi:LysR family transcriptional regulator [Serratia sp. UGAL515B_01]|uniref:LysR family transcriptional regulator n=1 Tax=Serratia sp. UGAL515B_01 TaxID=2986763 RepID=UPI002953AAB1|nr:LysR family transcriptional regulator [Serratia sp. UGAL515B_01]WON77717.1 LysR family transcriptional regulator [Serratia sp. UGAL515B_01]